MSTSLRGNSHPDTREHNSRLLLRAVFRHGPISRVGLSQISGLSASTVTRLVSSLVEDGLLMDIGTDDRRPGVRGAPQVLVDLNPRGAAVLAVQLGIYSRAAAVVDPRGTPIIYTACRDLHPDLQPQEVLDWVVDTAGDLLQEGGLSPSVLVGVGVSAEGLIDPAAGTRSVLGHHNWQDVPVVDYLAGRLALPVILRSAVHAQAAGELWIGRGPDTSSMVAVSMGTTVGCAVAMGNEVLRGHCEDAGAIGHVVVREDGLPCTCGKRGCLETIAGGQALNLAAREAVRAGRSPLLAELCGGSPDRLGDNEIARACAAGDPEATRIVREVATALGSALAGVVTVVQPEAVVVGSPLAQFTGRAFLDPLAEALAARGFVGHGRMPRVEATGLGPYGGAIGTAALALERFFYSPQLAQQGSLASLVGVAAQEAVLMRSTG